MSAGQVQPPPALLLDPRLRGGRPQSSPPSPPGVCAPPGRPAEPRPRMHLPAEPAAHGPRVSARGPPGGQREGRAAESPSDPPRSAAAQRTSPGTERPQRQPPARHSGAGSRAGTATRTTRSLPRGQMAVRMRMAAGSGCQGDRSPGRPAPRAAALRTWPRPPPGVRGAAAECPPAGHGGARTRGRTDASRAAACGSWAAAGCCWTSPRGGGRPAGGPPPAAAAQVQGASFRGWKEVTSLFNKDDEQRLLESCESPRSKGTNLRLKEELKTEKKSGFWDNLALKQNIQSKKPDEIEGWEPPKLALEDVAADSNDALNDHASRPGWEEDPKGSTKYTSLASSGNSSRWSLRSAGKLVSIRRQSKGHLTDHWEELE
nr:testis development-related protein isoform X2 [Equus caballus]